MTLGHVIYPEGGGSTLFRNVGALIYLHSAWNQRRIINWKTTVVYAWRLKTSYDVAKIMTHKNNIETRLSPRIIKKSAQKALVIP
jgi:hypothetical protein